MEAIVADIRDNGVTEEELERAKRSAIAQAIYSLDSQTALANIVGRALIVGSTLDDVQNWPSRIQAVTAADVQAVAAKYLQVTGPRPAISSRRTARGADARCVSAFPHPAAWSHHDRRRRPAPQCRGGRDSGSDQPGRHHCLAGRGLHGPDRQHEYCLPRRRGAGSGRIEAGLANLMSGLLDEGAGPLDSRAFQARLEDLNISLSFDAGTDAFYGNLRTLAQNRDEAFELFRLAVNEPRFDEEPVTRIRGQVTAGLRRGETDPNELASKVWARTMFGSHPYGRPSEGTIESVAAITADDLRAFAGRTMARDNLYVVVVGAISADDTRAALDTIFGSSA